MKLLYLSPYLTGIIYIIFAFYAHNNLVDNLSPEDKRKASTHWWAFCPRIYTTKGKRIATVGRFLIYYTLVVSMIFLLDINGLI